MMYCLATGDCGVRFTGNSAASEDVFWVFACSLLEAAADLLTLDCASMLARAVSESFMNLSKRCSSNNA